MRETEVEGVDVEVEGVAWETSSIFADDDDAEGVDDPLAFEDLGSGSRLVTTGPL